MTVDGSLWTGRKVLVTGHTGFKGAWLSLLLQRLGAEVVGVAGGPPTVPSLYEVAAVGSGMAAEHAVDVRDTAAVARVVEQARPEVVLHLAAQPMVRRSLVDPVGTYEVNVMGTVNVMEAIRRCGSVRAAVVVTSDKCYEQGDPEPARARTHARTHTRALADVFDGEGSTGLAGEPSQERARAHGRPPAPGRPFVEGDRLGGKDPYSSSKACAELVVSAYVRSFFMGDGDREVAPRVASARAGNVIGGGDWGEDRLLPDAVRVAMGLAEGPLMVRNPDAVRPWQHVLNPVVGYLVLAQELLRTPAACGAWNFGPEREDARTVGWVVERLREIWGGVPEWRRDGRPNPPEAAVLELDSSKARELLGWRGAWDLERGLRELVSWHDAHSRGEEMRAVSVGQIERFLADAQGEVDRPGSSGVGSSS